MNNKIYAVLFHDNSDGEHDEYHVLAYKKGERFFYCENDKPLGEYEGDKIVKVWPLFDDADSKSEQRVSNVVTLATDLICAVNSHDYSAVFEVEHKLNKLINGEEEAVC